MEIATAKDVTLTVAGAASQVSIAGTVGDALASVGVVPDADDEVSPAVDEVLTDGMEIRFVDVEVKTRSEVVAVAFKKSSVNSSKMLKGTSKVTQKGVKGKATVTWSDRYEDGKLVSSEKLDETVTKKPVKQITTIGTKKPAATTSSSGKAINLARAAMWDRIAKCESGNRWNINTGNGYYGGLQFNLATWRSVGGTDFAAYPHQATRAEQITVANRLYAKRGLQPWSCKP